LTSATFGKIPDLGIPTPGAYGIDEKLYEEVRP